MAHGTSLIANGSTVYLFTCCLTFLNWSNSGQVVVLLPLRTPPVLAPGVQPLAARLLGKDRVIESASDESESERKELGEPKAAVAPQAAEQQLPGGSSNVAQELEPTAASPCPLLAADEARVRQASLVGCSNDLVWLTPGCSNEFVRLTPVPKRGVEPGLITAGARANGSIEPTRGGT